MIRTTALPIDDVLPAIVASLKQAPNLVIEAPPGAGKTTRVPPALLRMCRGEVLVLEPRRIAARMAARRVATELGEQVGETVGYQVRFEDRIGPRTRVRFVTEGIATRRLLSDPGLRGVDAVVLDEFHERHLETDLALALLRRLQRTRPELRLIVMSATLDAEPIARYLGNCPLIRSEGRLFPLSVQHLPYSAQPLSAQVKRAVEILEGQRQSGNMLVFLPGAAEIRSAAKECEGVARNAGLLVLPLHGDLSPSEQDRAVLPSSERKLILATNIAESSVTVEGVNAVIDSGLARVSTHSQWTGLPSLQIARVSKASCTQRAGRAGRMGPGQVVRLYSEEDFMLRPEQELPEIKRADLSQLLLSLRALNIRSLEEVDWLDSPEPQAVQAAESLLDRLDATGPMVQRLVRYPLHPRLSRILVEALDRGVGRDGCRAVALLSVGARTERNDLLAAMEQPPDERLRLHTNQLLRIANVPKQSVSNDEELLLSVLAGFPDRVARRRPGGQLLLATGISAELKGTPPGYEFMVAIDAEDRRENAQPLVRLAARVEPEWLLELFPSQIHESVRIVWNDVLERVEEVRLLEYDMLTLEERRGNASEHDAANLLASKVLETGLEQFVERSALEQLIARVEFAGFDPPDIGRLVADVCVGLHSFSDFRRIAKDIVTVLEQQLNPRVLGELAPTSLKLRSGRQTKIHYEQGRSPWIASRLQDFFGMNDTPCIGPNRTQLVVHLLAPNHRAVQTTTDLCGFWQRLYPQVRRELMRRYPRHSWPEDPLSSK